MKVTSFRIQAIHNPAETMITGGRHLVLRLQTDEGIEGWSFASRIPRDYLPEMASVMRKMLDQLVVGQDPLNTEALNAKVYRNLLGAGFEIKAASGIEAALWDIKGKAAGLPVYKLMGGYRERVPAYASWKIEPRSNLEELAEAAATHVKNGFRSMKGHVGNLDRKGLGTYMRTLRDAVGDDIDIMIDVNQRWNLKKALDYGRVLEEYNAYWLEDPISVEDYDGMRELRETLSLPICAGETYRSARPFLRMLQSRSVDIVMVDQDIGLTSWLKVAHMAEVYETPIVPHTATEILAHLVAAVPNGLTVEYFPSVTPILKEPFQIEEGMIVLPDKPGFGFEFDEELLEKYTIA